MEDMFRNCTVKTNLKALNRFTGGLLDAELSSADISDSEKKSIMEKYPETGFLFELDHIVGKILAKTYLMGIEFQITDDSAEDILRDPDNRPPFFEYKGGESHLLVVHVKKKNEDEMEVDIFPVYFTSDKTWIYNEKMEWQEDANLQEIREMRNEDSIRKHLLLSLCREVNEHPYCIDPASTLAFFKRCQPLLQLAEMVGTDLAVPCYIPNNESGEDSSDARANGYVALIPGRLGEADGTGDTSSRVVYQGGKFYLYIDLADAEKAWGVEVKNKYIPILKEPSLKKMSQGLKFLWSEVNRGADRQLVFPLSASCYLACSGSDDINADHRCTRIISDGKPRGLTAAEEKVMKKLADAVRTRGNNPDSV